LSFTWKVQWSKPGAFDENSIPKPIGIFLTAVNPNTESDIWTNLFVDFCVEVLVNNTLQSSLKGKG